MGFLSFSWAKQDETWVSAGSDTGWPTEKADKAADKSNRRQILSRKNSLAQKLTDKWADSAGYCVLLEVNEAVTVVCELACENEGSRSQ